ncbi:YicC family protein [Schnuerera sp. xch1]|uniref:YicC/YloC family endoribonuclease n=1 Tax=Schnuerera sp. xch1 TaxID=2874283 RepID=UPI001CC02D21|nr:YicC/YloC family endoribonuclease [Schnuerera sp. xch1]MBZ2173936.1 YicC family protein [Schnuerera sp. xch1]
MIKSMTGFGRGENSDGIHNFNVEIKTVNHRYNDIIIKMPKHLNYLEEKIKKTIKKKINRGRVEVYVNLEYISESAVDVNVDIELAKAYKDALDEITNELQIEDDVKLSHILTFSEIVKTERKEYNEDVIWNCLSESTEAALQNVVNMRVEEGIALKNDMEIQLDKLKSMIVEIEKRAPLVVEDYRNKLKSRIDELIDKDYDLDEDRLNYEVAIFADKSDINEEVIRFKSHINQFLMSLESKDPIGRKLDFIIQEMNREINTIGSKANDLTITNYVVDIKSEVEKIREQVQNVE